MKANVKKEKKKENINLKFHFKQIDRSIYICECTILNIINNSFPTFCNQHQSDFCIQWNERKKIIHKSKKFDFLFQKLKLIKSFIIAGICINETINCGILIRSLIVSYSKFYKF